MKLISRIVFCEIPLWLEGVGVPVPHRTPHTQKTHRIRTFQEQTCQGSKYEHTIPSSEEMEAILIQPNPYFFDGFVQNPGFWVEQLSENRERSNSALNKIQLRPKILERKR